MSYDIKDWYADIPPITKFMFSTTFAGTVLVNFGCIPYGLVVLHWIPIYENYQIWRFLTCFFYYGQFSFNLIVHLIFLYQYSLLHEETTFENKPGDFITFLLFNMALLVPIGLAFGFMSLGIALMLAMVYVWCQVNKDQIVSFFMGFRFKAMYLPWVLTGFDLLVGHSIYPDIMGITVGHVYYFLVYVYPETSGKNIIFTPDIIKKYFPDRKAVTGMNGFVASVVNPREQVAARNAAPPRGHDWGSGRALGSNN